MGDRNGTHIPTRTQRALLRPDVMVLHVVGVAAFSEASFVKHEPESQGSTVTRLLEVSKLIETLRNKPNGYVREIRMRKRIVGFSKL